MSRTMLLAFLCMWPLPSATKRGTRAGVNKRYKSGGVGWRESGELTADHPRWVPFGAQGMAARSVTRTLELHNFPTRGPEGDMEALQSIRACALDPSGREEQWGDLCLSRSAGQCTVTFASHAIAVRARRTLAAHGILASFIGTET